MSYETWRGKMYADEQEVASAALFTYESEQKFGNALNVRNFKSG